MLTIKEHLLIVTVWQTVGHNLTLANAYAVTIRYDINSVYISIVTIERVVGNGIVLCIMEQFICCA